MKHIYGRYFLVLCLHFLFATAAFAQSPYATKVIEYKPAAGQFINKAPYGTPAVAPASVTGAPNGSIVSLGGFGGYVVVGFDQPVRNDPQNRYGVDFTVTGNAFSGWTEPGAVMVMKDVNGNGLADDTWYELAGSEYYFSRARNVNMTYFNPRYAVNRDVIWETDLGRGGVLRKNNFHKQPYYPQPDIFDNINADHQVYSGKMINIRVNRSNPGLITSGSFVFGYADNKSRNATPTVPRNPYFNDANGASADGFDISWAVDENGSSVTLDEIHFVKVYNAAQEDAGALGETSTEVDGVTITTPDPAWVPQDYYVQLIGSAPFQVLKGKSYTFEGRLFKNGIPQPTPGTWSVSNESVGAIDQSGTFTATERGQTIIQYSADASQPLATFTIEVVDLVDMVLTTNDPDIYINEQAYVHAEGIDHRALPANRFVYDTYTYSVSDESIATISQSGIVTGKAAGVVTVTVTSKTNGGISKTIPITITAPPAIVLAPGADKRTYTSGVTTQRIDLNTVFSVTGDGQIFSAVKTNSNTHLVAASIDDYRYLNLTFAEGAAGTTILTLAATAYGVTQDFPISITVTPLSATVKPKQVVFVNGGQFGSTPGNVQVLDAATLEVEKLADFDRAQSVQDIVTEGKYAYVSAEYDIIKYDLITMKEVGRRFTQDKSSEVADGQSEDGAGVNHSMTIYKNYLIATRQNSYGPPDDGYNVRIYNKHDLTLVKKIPLSTEASDVVVAGDSAFVAINGGFQGQTGKLAIIDLVNLEKKEEFDFGADGTSIMQMFTKDKHILILAQEKLLDYSIKDRTYTLHSVPIGHSDFSSSPLATELVDDKLYSKVNWGAYAGENKGFGIVNTSTFTVAENDIFGMSTDPDITNNGWAFMAASYDHEDKKFYVTFGQWWGDGAGFIYDEAGSKIGTFGHVETSPERMAISYAVASENPYTIATLEDISIFEKQSFERDLNEFFTDDGSLVYTAKLTGGESLPEWLTLDGAVLSVTNAPADVALEAIVEITATDEYGQLISETVTVRVVPVDDAPVVEVPIAEVTVDESADHVVISLTDVFADEDGDPASFTYAVIANTNETLVTPAIDGSSLTLSFQPGQSGDAAITVEVSSGDKKAETTFHVTVKEKTITGIHLEAVNIAIYPNPVIDELRIRTENIPASSLTLFGASGETLVAREGTSTEEIIDMRFFAPGIYILSVKTRQGEVKRKVFKQ